MTNSNTPKNDTPTKVTVKEQVIAGTAAAAVGLGLCALSYAGSRMGLEYVLRRGMMRVDVRLPEGYEIVKTAIETV